LPREVGGTSRIATGADWDDPVAPVAKVIFECDVEPPITTGCPVATLCWSVEAACLELADATGRAPSDL
jgi:hypothetical protein